LLAKQQKIELDSIPILSKHMVSRFKFHTKPPQESGMNLFHSIFSHQTRVKIDV